MKREMKKKEMKKRREEDVNLRFSLSLCSARSNLGYQEDDGLSDDPTIDFLRRHLIKDERESILHLSSRLR